jgi:hypothetical protein
MSVQAQELCLLNQRYVYNIWNVTHSLPVFKPHPSLHLSNIPTKPNPSHNLIHLLLLFTHPCQHMRRRASSLPFHSTFQHLSTSLPLPLSRLVLHFISPRLFQYPQQPSRYGCQLSFVVQIERFLQPPSKIADRFICSPYEQTIRKNEILANATPTL